MFSRNTGIGLLSLADLVVPVVPLGLFLGRLAQLATQLGLSPAAEKALRHDSAREAAHARWLRMADQPWVPDIEPVEPEPAASADSAPTPETTNGAAK